MKTAILLLLCLNVPIKGVELPAKTITMFLNPIFDVKLVCKEYPIRYKLSLENFIENVQDFKRQLGMLQKICSELPPNHNACSWILIEIDIEVRELQQRMWAINSYSSGSANTLLHSLIVKKRELKLPSILTDQVKSILQETVAATVALYNQLENTTQLANYDKTSEIVSSIFSATELSVRHQLQIAKNIQNLLSKPNSMDVLGIIPPQEIVESIRKLTPKLRADSCEFLAKPDMSNIYHQIQASTVVTRLERNSSGQFLIIDISYIAVNSTNYLMIKGVPLPFDYYDRTYILKTVNKHYLIKRALDQTTFYSIKQGNETECRNTGLGFHVCPIQISPYLIGKPLIAQSAFFVNPDEITMPNSKIYFKDEIMVAPNGNVNRLIRLTNHIFYSYLISPEYIKFICKINSKNENGERWHNETSPLYFAGNCDVYTNSTTVFTADFRELKLYNYSLNNAFNNLAWSSNNNTANTKTSSKLKSLGMETAGLPNYSYPKTLFLIILLMAFLFLILYLIMVRHLNQIRLSVGKWTKLKEGNETPTDYCPMSNFLNIPSFRIFPTSSSDVSNEPSSSNSNQPSTSSCTYDEPRYPSVKAVNLSKRNIPVLPPKLPKSVSFTNVHMVSSTTEMSMELQPKPELV